MDIRKKLSFFELFQTAFPTWALKRKANVIYHAFDGDLAKAKKANNTSEYNQLRGQQEFETSEYLDELRALQSRRLVTEAQRLYIHIPDLEWEIGVYGNRYLRRASESKAYYAVKEQKDKNREYWLKFVSAMTGLIGVLIGLIASFKK